MRTTESIHSHSPRSEADPFTRTGLNSNTASVASPSAWPEAWDEQKCSPVQIDAMSRSNTSVRPRVPPVPPAQTSTLGGRRWRMECDIAYHSIDIDAVRTRADLFFVVVSASFIESGTDMYTRNLVEKVQAQLQPQTSLSSSHQSPLSTQALESQAAAEGIKKWLGERWEGEEMQHGRALRTYIEHVWPEFDWQRAFDAFFAEYGAVCTMEELEPTVAREMVARCVVETGTTCYYQSMRENANEPVLRDLADKIRADEVGHYKRFFEHFRTTARDEQLTRTQTLAVLGRRLLALRNSDSEIALRHVWNHWTPVGPKKPLKQMRKEVAALVGSRLPIALAFKMLTKPLRLSPKAQQRWERPVVSAAQFLMGRGLLG